MTIKLIFTIFAIISYLIGFVPYLKDIARKKVQPHAISWAGWGLTTLLAFFAMSSELFNWAAFIVLVNSLACFVVVIFSYVKGVAVTIFSQYDSIFLVSGLLGVVLWQYFNNPDLAIIFAIIPDLSFGIPTIIKTYTNPFSETKLAWLMSTLSGFFSIFAISYVSFTEIAYPIYLFIFDLTVFLLVTQIIRSQKKKSLGRHECV
ncbi:hypothetical protein KC866_00085 [Patescibacteria group bacterium]|nr:hypothetical protein [Patescibacteria group bacterium]